MEHSFIFSEKKSDYRVEGLDSTSFTEAVRSVEYTMNTTVYIDNDAADSAVATNEKALQRIFNHSELEDELCEVIGDAQEIHDTDQDSRNDDLKDAEFPFYSDMAEYRGVKILRPLGDQYQVGFAFTCEISDEDDELVEHTYFIPHDKLIKFIPNVELEDEEEWYPTILKRLADGSKKFIESTLYQKASNDTKIAMLSTKEQKIFENVRKRYAEKSVSVIPEEHYCITEVNGEITPSFDYVDHKATLQPVAELRGTIVAVRFLDFIAPQGVPDVSTPILPYPCLVLAPEKEDRAYLIPISSVLAIDVLRAQSQ